MKPINFIDPTAILHSTVKVWHFAVILADTTLGEGVSVGSGVEIGRGTVIGRGSRISHGVFLPPKTFIGRDVFIGPSVTFTDDRYPRANNTDYHHLPPIVHDGASIGAGAIILPGIRIGEHAVIGAGAVVTKDVPAKCHIRSEPARLHRLSSIASRAFAMVNS